MTLPNLLTASRLGLTVGFIYLIGQDRLGAISLATGLFVLAAVTDYLDGYLAKRLNKISNLGKIMDPIADKFLILSAFFVFARLGIIAGWMFWVIAVREIFLTGYRLLAMGQGRILAAEKAGKYKTALQMASVLVILGSMIARRLDLFEPWDALRRQDVFSYVDAGIWALMVITVLVTVYSGLSYLWNNRAVFKK